MKAIKITVLKRALYQDLVKAHSANQAMRPCEQMADGQVFIGGLQRPEGFCEWAWTDISRQVVALSTGGEFDRGVFARWMNRPGAAIASCSDGFRPVSFLIERIDTKELIDTAGVVGAAPREVYDSERWGEFSYAFSGLGSGAPCRVRLHFCEIYHGAAGKRCFAVELNGRRVLNEFDVFAEAGGKFKAIVKEFEVQADSTGALMIDFKKGSADNPKLSAVEIIGGGKTIYAVNAGGQAAGAFQPDAFYRGGNAFGE